MEIPKQYENEGKAVDPESATTESLESVTNPEQVLGTVLTGMESASESDSKGWKEKAKEFFETREGKIIKNTGNVVGFMGAVVPFYFIVKFGTILKFIAKFVEKRGNMTFKEGKEIGESMFSILDDEKGKK